MAFRTATVVALALAGAVLAGTALTSCSSPGTTPAATDGTAAGGTVTGGTVASGTASPAAVSTATAGPAGASPSATAEAASTQLTGTQLEAALPPASYFPPGFPVSGSSSSGSRLRSAPPRINLATAGCGSFMSSDTNGELGATAFAVRLYANKAATETFGVTVYQSRSPGTAMTLFGDLRAAFTRCDTADGAVFSVTARPVPVASLSGRPTAEFDVTMQTQSGKFPSDLLMTVAGPDVFMIVKEGIGVPPPASPALSVLMPGVVTRVLAAQS